ITSLLVRPPTPAEIERERNRFWGQHLRYHSSSINQAYYLGLYEYLGVGAEYDFGQIDSLRKVSVNDVTDLARKYFADASWLTTAVAGRGVQ
ncbi:MAG: hypothetical protein ACREJQ_02835, partial [bacterium]